MEIFKKSPCFCIRKNNREIILNGNCEYDNVQFMLNVEEKREYSVVHAELLNKSDFEYAPQKISVKLGIDTYLDTYPDWNDKLFPTMLRFEKTHMYGYFMSPNGDMLGICSDSPAAGYSFDYNKLETESYGHRIEDVNFDLICEPPLPDRFNTDVTMLRPNEKKIVNIYLLPGLNEDNVFKKINEVCGIPIILSKKYTLNSGEKIDYDIMSQKKCHVVINSPNGELCKNTDKPGMYILTVKQEDGYEAQALYYVRKDYRWYLEKARENMIAKPPKATTHCESWYAFFSGYLAMKHYPNKDLDTVTNSMFDEIMPMVFDFENARPKVIPERIQNIAAFISLLADRYEAEKDIRYLHLASEYGDLLMKKQKRDGGYYRNNTHYTCVIYPAKSLMELYHAEFNSNDEVFIQKGKIHYNSVKKAIDDLVERLDDLETEGEMTFEDGMISCAALQIAYFALDLPSCEREKYISAAKYMISKHRCLEQNNIADCRMNGASIRYWEAQYDVNYVGNMLNSPHGWTAWTIYAKYYLFLLTGEAVYLKEFQNALGACLQLMSLDGDLMWSFVCEPHLKTKIFVKDEDKPIKDAYKSVCLSNSGYRGKYISSVICEQYIPMISDWYRVSEENPVVGGYSFCPLFLETETIRVDNQGGACDNDVHEIFKCMEEVALHKAFIAKDGKELICYGCRAETENERIYVTVEDDTKILYSAIKDKNVIVKGQYLPEVIKVG